jgi:PPOX class probable F420-dependent enzyme
VNRHEISSGAANDHELGWHGGFDILCASLSLHACVFSSVWFLLDGNEVVFSTGKSSAKGRNLLRDSHVMISVDDEQPPFAFVLIDGMAAVEELSPQELLPLAIRIARRYVAPGQTDAYGKRNAVEGELLVRVPLTKVIARKGIAD